MKQLALSLALCLAAATGAVLADTLELADGTLLDHSQILFGSTIKDGNRHDERDLPLLLAGGAKGQLNPGRRVRFQEETPLCNVLLKMLHTAGVPGETFGDSTAVAEGL